MFAAAAEKHGAAGVDFFWLAHASPSKPASYIKQCEQSREAHQSPWQAQPRRQPGERSQLPRPAEKHTDSSTRRSDHVRLPCLVVWQESLPQQPASSSSSSARQSQAAPTGRTWRCAAAAACPAAAAAAGLAPAAAAAAAMAAAAISAASRSAAAIICSADVAPAVVTVLAPVEAASAVKRGDSRAVGRGMDEPRGMHRPLTWLLAAVAGDSMLNRARTPTTRNSTADPGSPSRGMRTNLPPTRGRWSASACGRWCARVASVEGLALGCGLQGRAPAEHVAQTVQAVPASCCSAHEHTAPTQTIQTAFSPCGSGTGSSCQRPGSCASPCSGCMPAMEMRRLAGR